MRTEIRLAAHADHDAVVAIARSGMESFGIRWEPDTLDRDMASFGDGAPHKLGELVAVEDGVIVGCIAAVSYGEDRAKIMGLYVVPAARGRGYGPQLLSAVIDRCRQVGVRRFCLDTWTHMSTAVRLYERTGWVRGPDPDPSHGCNRTYTLEI